MHATITRYDDLLVCCSLGVYKKFFALLLKIMVNLLTDERKSPCVLQDFVPFGAAALLPLTQIHNHAKQGNGYRRPHIALGRLVFNFFPNDCVMVRGAAAASGPMTYAL